MEARQVILLGLALIALGSQPTVVDGQQATTDTVFVGGERSAVLSGVLEYFPILGFAYAGDWKRGFLPNAFRVASFRGGRCVVPLVEAHAVKLPAMIGLRVQSSARRA